MQRGVAVTNTPDVLSAATADMGILLLLAAARRLVECDSFVRQQSGRTYRKYNNMVRIHK